MKKKDMASDQGSEWSPAPATRLGPQDIQQKEFRVARVGAGYRMREVDEFLDQVTDALSELVAENERLLRAAGGGAPAAAPSATRPSSPMPADEASRSAVEAFLRREKGFLQDLGGLVQVHAEELRSMVRELRRDASEPSDGSPAPVAATALMAEPVAVEEPVALEEHVAVEEPVAVEDPVDTGEPEEPQQPAPEATMAIDPTDRAEEPIRLEEPEPARSARAEDDERDSLKELFWGEE